MERLFTVERKPMRTTIFGLAVLIAVIVEPSVAEADSRPNIVLIMADDLGWSDVAFHGGNVATPHLDRLVMQSLELTQHYVAPVCTPTRAGLLTGRCWSRFGITTPRNERSLPWETVTLASALKSVGYDTCLTGKWHLGSKPEWGPNRFGFDHAYGSLAGGVNSFGHFYKKGPYSVTWHRNGELIEESGHVTDLLTNEAIRWLRGRGNRPFFLYVPFTAVHLPVDEPTRWLDRVPKSITGEVPRHYAACIMHLDDAVGRILAAVKASGKSDKTLVVFTSDNGGSTSENNDTRYPFATYPQGRLPGRNLPFRGKKGDLYEGGIRVPTIVHWPGVLQPGQCSTPIHIIDWMPTLCALAGYQSTDALKWDGSNIWSTLTGEAELAERDLYWAGTNFRSSAIRRGDWKLIVHSTGKATIRELFNLRDDPNESQDLAEKMPLKVTALAQRLASIAKNDRDAEVVQE
jgi:arylsulfatase A-like enzyme